MQYVARAPAPPLDSIGDDLYYLAGTAPHPRLTLPPMPSALVIINLAASFRITHPGGSEDFADGCVWATPTCRTTFEYPRDTMSVGVHLKPWGLVPVTGAPAAMLGLPVPVEAVWGAMAKELADRLDSAATPGAMLDVLEAALLARVRPVAGLGLVRDASTRISRSAGRLSIAGLTEAAGVSSTHLAARFKHLVGATPKRLARTYRFAEVVSSVDPAREVDWAEVAHRAGFYDQPHFINELQRFTGITPTAYLDLRRRFAAEHPGQRARRRAAAARVIFSKPGRGAAGQDRGMSKVVMQTIVSVDGFIATADDQVGPLFDWFGTGDTPLYENGPLVTRQSYDYYRPMLDAIGALVVGRHVFDMTDGWGGAPPAGDHCVVVSHRPAPEGWDPAAPFHFVDGVTDAVRLAKELAGDRTVSIAAGDVGGQIFEAGLVDEVALDVVPVVFGTGKRFFGPLSTQVLLEDPDEVVQGARVLHLRFRVRR